jgi:cytochrome c biogenesis protein CcdA
MNKKGLINLIYFLLVNTGIIFIVYLIWHYYQPCYQCVAGGYNFSEGGFSMLTLAALTDSINPCALAVLMILLEGLVLIRKNVLKIGFAFVIGIFLSYLLIGLGIVSGLELIDNSNLFHQIVAVIAILVGIFNIKDYFFYGKLFHMEIPTKWRPKMGTILQKATTPIIALVVGFVISAFELPCTGGPYLFALGLLKGQDLPTVWYLIYYNLIFVLPLIIVILAVHFSYVKIEKTEQWRQKNIKLLHLIAGIVMLALGVWLWLI